MFNTTLDDEFIELILTCTLDDVSKNIDAAILKLSEFTMTIPELKDKPIGELVGLTLRELRDLKDYTFDFLIEFLEHKHNLKVLCCILEVKKLSIENNLNEVDGLKRVFQ